MSVCNKTPAFLKMLAYQANIQRKNSFTIGATLQRYSVFAAYSTSTSDILSSDNDKVKPMGNVLIPKFDYANEFSVQPFEKKDISDVEEFMKLHYYHRNPLRRMLNLTYEDDKDYLHHVLTAKAGNGVSFIARHRNTKKVVATCLPKILLRNEDRSIIQTYTKGSNFKLRHCLYILELLRNSVNLFEKYNVDKILEIASGVVDENYGKKGIVRHLTYNAIERGNTFGCQLGTGQATNLISQNQALKFGVTVEYILDFASLEIDGQKVLDFTRSPETTCAMVVSLPIPLK